ncbi:hypothetical protein CASFOL_038480 [Castilleja foliolosa]|uniref:Uncharacterized protein n=1 Tax=Castilleja foliolosa TaxID=1961234 RepID=A0ABD3BLX8_9LAMI
MAINIVENCQIAPSSRAPAEQLLKLLHFDMLWLLSSPLKILVFYDLSCSESYFLDTVVPNLKNSLSLSLKHFPSLAGKILIPYNSRPVSRYVGGEDSVSMTISVSNADFKKAIGYHSREADEVHGLVSPPDSSTIKLLAIQVTLFPNQGVCIGLTGHHSTCDGPALTLFMKAWASINKFNGDESRLFASGEECLPFYNRDVVPDGDQLADECWSHVKMLMPTITATTAIDTLHPMVTTRQRTFHATIVLLSEAEMKILKSFVLHKKPDMVRVSSFSVACAHLWTCFVKAAAAAGEEVADDEPEYISFLVDCRGRFRPPLPNNYFGNCMLTVVTESTNGTLRGNKGLLSAAEVIGEAIRKTIDNERGIMDGYTKSVLEFVKRRGERMLIVGGSPRLDFYGIDYGWGGPIKYEAVSDRDSLEVFFLSKSRKYRGGMEIGVLMSKVRMDAFAAVFDRAKRKKVYGAKCKTGQSLGVRKK